MQRLYLYLIKMAATDSAYQKINTNSPLTSFPLYSMKRLIILCVAIYPGFLLAQHFTYPATPFLYARDTIQQTIVENEFKWLEKTESKEVKNWIDQQNDFTDRYFRKNTGILSVQEQLTDIASVQYNYGQKQRGYYLKLLYNGKAPRFLVVTIKAMQMNRCCNYFFIA